MSRTLNESKSALLSVFNVNKPQKRGWRNDEEFNQYVRMTFDLYLFLDVVVSIKVSIKLKIIQCIYDRNKLLNTKEMPWTNY